MNLIIESIQKDLKDLNRKYCCLLTSSQSLLTVTKAELDTLITNETLIPGQLYKVTGVDTALYGGTDILIKAATNSELELSGHGIFYNPKYLNSITTPNNGYGVYNNYVFYSLTSRVNTINNGEIVTANNGATGKFRTYGALELLTGDWSSAASFSVGAKSAVITIISTPSSYSIGANVIWGGKHWTNKTGNIGTITDAFTLDSTNWELVPFNETDYNVEIDEISYDYQNDLIVSRKDRWNNNVTFTKDIIVGYSRSPIKGFQWGNYPEDNNTNTDISPGVTNNTVNNSLLDCINFRGRTLKDNILTSLSELDTFITDSTSHIYNNNLSKSYIFGNTIYDNTTIYGITLKSYGGFYNNIMLNFYFESNILDYSSLRNTTLEYGTFRIWEMYNSTITFFPKVDDNIFNLRIQNVFNTFNLSSATIIFNYTPKQIFTNSSFVARLSYVNGSDVFTVVNVNA
jgi:hypothetical protein